MRLGAWGILRNTRHYSNKFSRNPVQVITNEELLRKRSRFRPVVEVPPVDRLPSKISDASGDPATLEGKPSRLPPGFPPYDTKGEDDTDLSRFALATSNAKSRLKSGLIMLEGTRLIQEGLRANLKPKAVFFSRVENVTKLQLPPRKFAFQKVTYEKIRRWSKLTNPPGVVGFFEKPGTSAQLPANVFPFSIICDNIRDPGNLGSILRVAASAGCRSLFLTKGCVDLWNEKVLRSAMGSHFHLNILENIEWNHIEAVLEPNSYLLFADNSDTDHEGVKEIVQNDVSHESIQQHLEDLESDQHEINSSDSNIEKTAEKLPVFSYYLINYPAMSSIFLVLGGETGLSPDALNLGKSHNRCRVNIPMLNHVESLNVSSALSILTHEMKRQFELAQHKDEMDSVKIPTI